MVAPSIRIAMSAPRRCYSYCHVHSDLNLLLPWELLGGLLNIVPVRPLASIPKTFPMQAEPGVYAPYEALLVLVLGIDRGLGGVLLLSSAEGKARNSECRGEGCDRKLHPSVSPIHRMHDPLRCSVAYTRSSPTFPCARARARLQIGQKLPKHSSFCAKLCRKSNVQRAIRPGGRG